MIRTVGCPVLAAIRRKDSSICSCNSSTPFSYLMSEAISDHQRPSILIEAHLRETSQGHFRTSKGKFVKGQSAAIKLIKG